MSKNANFLARISLFFRRKKIPKDNLSGFFGGETSLFRGLIQKNLSRFESRGYKILFDFLKILPPKTKIKEVTYNFGERKRGESKIKSEHILSFLKSLIK